MRKPLRLYNWIGLGMIFLVFGAVMGATFVCNWVLCLATLAAIVVIIFGVCLLLS